MARYGGDEFLVVMTGRDREYAEEHARQLCMGIRECEIPNEDSSVEPWLTISVGGVCAIPKEPNRVWDFLSAADKTLYDQKMSKKEKYASMWEKDNTYSSATKIKGTQQWITSNIPPANCFAGLHLILKIPFYLVDGSVLCSTDHGL